MRATTDSDNKIKYDLDNKPGISNLISIYASLSNLKIEEVEDKFKDSNYGEFKKEVASLVISILKPIKEKYNEYINSNIISEILDNGKNITSGIAKEKYEMLKEIVGLHR